MTQRDLYIVGAGGFGREVSAMIQSCPRLNKLYRIKAFIDDDASQTGYGDIPVMHGIEDVMKALPSQSNCALAIGNSVIRRSVFERVSQLDLRWPNLIHSTIHISDPIRVEFGRGIIACPGSILTTGIAIGDFSLINLSCTLGHDVVFESFTSLMPGCHISGSVRCGEAAFLGSGAVVLNGIHIGANAVVGAGAVVRQNVKPDTVVAGVPAIEI